jgi:hypothetical protein
MPADREAMDDHAAEARRLKLRHDSAFYGPMKDDACGCDLCLWLQRYLALIERAEQAEAALRLVMPATQA